MIWRRLNNKKRRWKVEKFFAQTHSFFVRGQGRAIVVVEEQAIVVVEDQAILFVEDKAILVVEDQQSSLSRTKQSSLLKTKQSSLSRTKQSSLLRTKQSSLSRTKLFFFFLSWFPIRTSVRNFSVRPKFVRPSENFPAVRKICPSVRPSEDFPAAVRQKLFHFMSRYFHAAFTITIF